MEIPLIPKEKKVLDLMDYEKLANEVSDHIIVCGYGRVGKAVVRELDKHEKDVVIVEMEAKALIGLPPKTPIIYGDATTEVNLMKAGIERASGLITTCGNDAANILIVVTAKALNPKIKLVARASRKEDIERMYKVGADEVISPEFEIGKVMAKEALSLE